MNTADSRRLSHKVLPAHLDKQAVVYARQSTPHQVAENRESGDLQYQLAHRAVELGWAAACVLVIDEDQGKSGQSADNRPGNSALSRWGPPVAVVRVGPCKAVTGEKRPRDRVGRSKRHGSAASIACV